LQHGRSEPDQLREGKENGVMLGELSVELAGLRQGREGLARLRTILEQNGFRIDHLPQKLLQGRVEFEQLRAICKEKGVTITHWSEDDAAMQQGLVDFQ